MGQIGQITIKLADEVDVAKGRCPMMRCVCLMAMMTSAVLAVPALAADGADVLSREVEAIQVVGPLDKAVAAVSAAGRTILVLVH